MRRRPVLRRVVLVATVAVIGVIVTGALAGCGLVRTLPPQAAPGSPAASGANMNPEVASEEIGTRQVPIAGKVEPPLVGAYQGVFVPPAPFDMTFIDAYEKVAGKPASIVMWYQPWARNNRSEPDAAACLAIMRRGAVPLITWEPWDPGYDANFLVDPSNQPQFRLSEITAGYYDGYIRSWAQQLKRLGGPVMLRPMHEMNGTWYPWGGTVNTNTSARYVQAWRRMHDIFDSEGANNVTWVWSINRDSVPDTPQNAFSAYYPGDAYVDWTSISGFNWGTTDPTKGGWRSYTRQLAAPLAYLQTLPKPICLSEIGTVEQGGDKAAWITDAYSRIAENPRIKAIVYFDALEKRPTNTQDWRVDTSQASLAAYQTAIASPYYPSTPPKVLSDWAAHLTTSDWTYLGALIPRY